MKWRRLVEFKPSPDGSNIAVLYAYKPRRAQAAEKVWDYAAVPKGFDLWERAGQNY